MLRPKSNAFTQASCVALALGLTIASISAQNATELPQQKEKKKQEKIVAKEQEKTAQRANLEIRGNRAFDDKTLRSQLKEQIATIEQYGLTTARGDDAAFFLELYYKKHGYAKVQVSYALVGGNGLRLDIVEGPLVHLGRINFVGVGQLPEKKAFRICSPADPGTLFQNTVASAVCHRRCRGRRRSGAAFLRFGRIHRSARSRSRSTITSGLIWLMPGSSFTRDSNTFSATPFSSAQPFMAPRHCAARCLTCIGRPYTEARLADIPRRLQSYYKTRGYFAVKVDAVGEPTLALHGRVPVRVTIEPGPVYRFDGVTVSGTKQLHPSYLAKRFRKFRGQPYSPEVLDKRFRELMRTSLFNILQIKPTPIGGNLLRLDINVEEAKPQEFGFSIGYGSFDGAIVGASYANRDLFGYGRPITTAARVFAARLQGGLHFRGSVPF